MSQTKDEENEFWRGYDDGVKERSAAEVGAYVVALPLLAKEYVGGVEKGQEDRANGKA